MQRCKYYALKTVKSDFHVFIHFFLKHKVQLTTAVTTRMTVFPPNSTITTISYQINTALTYIRTWSQIHNEKLMKYLSLKTDARCSATDRRTDRQTDRRMNNA